jgi:hypothetical protein
MSVRVKMLVGLGLTAVASISSAQTYNMDLTSAGNGTVADGVYVSPYVGTVSGPGVNYSGYLICDDFNTESYLNQPWVATLSNAGALNGSQKFGNQTPGYTITFDGQTYTIQQAYNAAGWLANGLLGNLNNSTTQTNYAFAIWDLFDGQSTDPDGGAQVLEAAALAAASGTNPYVATNVSIFTPYQSLSNPTAYPNLNASQEFLMVRPAPEMDATAATGAITLLLGGVLVLRGRRQIGT